MKSLSKEMAAAGKPLDDEEVVTNILNGLDAEYNPLVFALISRVEPISVAEWYAQLLSFETRLDLQQDGSDSSANNVNRGGRGTQGSSRGRGTSGNRGRGSG